MEQPSIFPDEFVEAVRRADEELQAKFNELLTPEGLKRLREMEAAAVQGFVEGK